MFPSGQWQLGREALVKLAASAHATTLLRQMVPPHLVQRRLGHSDPAFTLRVYADVLPGQQQEAADGFTEALRRARDAG